MILGALMDFAAFGFAAQSLIAPLGSVTLICNAVLAPYILGETIARMDIISTCIIAGGCSLSIAFGEHSTRFYSLEDLESMFNSVPVYMFFMAVVSSCIVSFTFVTLLEFKVTESCVREDDEEVPDSPRLNTSGPDEEAVAQLEPAKLEVLEMLEHMPGYLHVYHAFAYAYMGGILGSCSVLFGKTVAEMMKGIFRKDSDLSAWGTYQFYMFLIAMIITLLFQMKFLNVGLKYHDTLIVVPIYQTWWVLGGIVGGGTYFKEFEGMEGINIVLFVTGVVITLCGVYILTYFRKKMVEEEKTLPEGGSADGTSILLDDRCKISPRALNATATNEVPAHGGAVPKERCPIRKVLSDSCV